jgi:hypothetical protein
VAGDVAAGRRIGAGGRLARCESPSARRNVGTRATESVETTCPGSGEAFAGGPDAACGGGALPCPQEARIAQLTTTRSNGLENIAETPSA